MRHRPVGQHHVLLNHMVDRLAVVHRSRAARVVRHHAADRGAVGGRNVGSEPETVRPERRVQLVKHDARLHASPAFGHVHFQHVVEVLGRVHLKAGADRLARLRGASPAHRQRTSMLAADLDGANDVFPRFHDDDAHRLDPVHAGIGGVERTRDLVEPHFALDDGVQIAAQSLDVERADVSLGDRWSPFDGDRMHLESADYNGERSRRGASSPLRPPNGRIVRGKQKVLR